MPCLLSFCMYSYSLIIPTGLLFYFYRHGSMRQYNFPKKSLLALLIPTMMCHTIQAHADDSPEPKVHLGHETITISRTPQEEVGETIVTRRELNEQMVQNSQDLVRYNTEVDVAEVGRYGNKGFAIRGVDGNRVAMNVDGLALPEVEVNEIFSPYGYQYEGRFNPDLEMMGNVRIATGSDSLFSGSGAVGGSVSYMTKEPVSMVKNGNLGGYAKVGYANKNEEWLSAVGLAGVYNKAEFLLNHAHREGHELKNHDMKSHDNSQLDPMYLFPKEYMPYRSKAPSYNGDTKSLIYPDALDHKSDSTLAKFYYHLTDEHRMGIHGMYQERSNHMNIDSKNITNGSRLGGVRRAHDVEKLESYGMNYRYMPNSSQWLDQLQLNYSHNKAFGLADTWLYERAYNDGGTVVLSSILSNREYRPTATVTDQLDLKVNLLPLSFNKFGEHNLFLNTTYKKQDYTSTAIDKHVKFGEYLKYAFPDAKKDIYSISLIDNIYFTERLKAMIGVRYDDYKYSPYFQNTDEHKSNTNTCTNTLGRNWLSDSLYCKTYREQAGLTSDDLSAFTHWRDGDEKRETWRADNYGKYTGLQDSKFNHITWSGAIDYQAIPNRLTTRYKIGTGFLAPTVTQIYSNYTFNGASQVPNYNLKPEKSLNQELELDWRVVDGINLTMAGYLTQYDDFIHTRFWQGSKDNPNNQGCDRGTCLQSINLDKAKVYGIKLAVNADLSDKLNTDGKLNVFANFHTAKDSATIDTDNNGKVKINTLAAVPTSLLLGGTYTSPDDKWSLSTRINWIQRKKPKDVKNLEVGEDATESYGCRQDIIDYYGYCPPYFADRITNYDYYEYVGSYDHIHRSKSVALFDVFGSMKFGKNNNWILNAGIYNITNEKYIPWETLRQFATTSVNSLVDSEGHGFNRYTAPGRNYALSLTYEF